MKTYDVAFHGGQATGTPFPDVPLADLLEALADALPELGEGESVTVSRHADSVSESYQVPPGSHNYPVAHSGLSAEAMAAWTELVDSSHGYE